MAIHRTKQEKMRAVARRKEQFGFTQTAGTSHSSVLPSKPTDPLKSSRGELLVEMQRNATYLQADLRRTMVVTAILMTLLIGIWWLNRYNGFLVNL